MILSLISDKELFERLLDATPDSMVIVDQSGTIVLVNDETARQFGYKKSELLGKPVEILVPERYHLPHFSHRKNYFNAPINRAMGTGRDLYALRRDGSEFAVEISLSPLQTPAGLLVTSAIRDVSWRKQQEEEIKSKAEELARSNAELEQFAYVASHDLQEPLRAIAGACQVLARKFETQLDSEAKEFVGFAVEGCKRLQDLVADLLSYSRVTSKAKEFAPVDCQVVLARAKDNLRVAIDERHATITCGPLPVLLGDTSQLIALFQNLIGNSIKFHRPGVYPEVVVQANEDSEGWHFTVGDNGIGIEAKYFERIFVLFKRLHSKDSYPGTGIGLASAKKIIERHGGRIWVESEIDRGTTVHFILPAIAH